MPLDSCPFQAVDGFNVCIFAYGQTGSGKTFTMIGDSNRPMQHPGIAPRAFMSLFQLLGEIDGAFSWKVSVYMVELYCGQLLDLFASNQPGDEKANMKIRKNKKGMVVVEGLITKSAQSADELYSIFEAGSARRKVATTKMNAESSRSHLVIGIVVETTNKQTGQVTLGKLSLVDLAGSERFGKTGATGQQAVEAKSINLSLSALAEVIKALSTNNPHVPFRNSILTQLMQVGFIDAHYCCRFGNRVDVLTRACKRSRIIRICRIPLVATQKR